MKRLAPAALVLLAVVGAVAAVMFAFNADTPGAVPPSKLELPPPSRVRFIDVPRAYIHTAPDERSPVVGAYAAGAKVLVTERVNTKGGNWSKTVDGGYIADNELVERMPSAANELEVARAALREGSLIAAMSAGRRAVVVDPALREGWDLLAGTFDAVGDAAGAREAYEKRAALPAPAAVEEAVRWPAPKAKDKRYVDATTLRAFAKPTKKSKVLTRLPINQEVLVKSVNDDFAEVTWTPRTNPVWVVDVSKPDSARRVDPPAKPQKAFVLWAYLSPEAVTLEKLAARRLAAEEKQDVLGVTRALERSVALSGNDPALTRQLMRAATDAKQYALAAVQAVRLGPGGANSASDGVGRPESIDVFFGCESAPPLDHAGCTNLDVDVIAPCAACETDDPMEGADGENPPPPKPATPDEVRAKFPSGPWVHVVLGGDSAVAAKNQRAFLFAVPFEPVFSCDQETTVVKHGALKLWSPPGLWPGKDGRVEMWMTGAGYERTHFGVVSATDEAEARALIKAGVKDARALDARVRVASGPWQECDCCAFQRADVGPILPADMPGLP